MKISFLDDEPEIFPLQYGGKARTIINLAKQFLRFPEVENISILSRSIRNPSSDFVWQGINFKKLEGYSTIRKILDEASSCNILNVHTCSSTMPYLEGFDTTIVYHLHDVIFSTADAGSHLDKAMGNNWSAIISPSTFASETLENLCWWNSLKSRILTVPRGIDFDCFYPRKKEDALNKIRQLNQLIAKKIYNSYPVIFFPHRYNANKGEEFLMELYGLLQGKYTNPLILATSEDGVDLAGIEKISWIPTEHMGNFYSVADVSVVASKSPEAFSQVPLESVVCGTPVLAFKFGNLTNLIDEFPSIKSSKPEPKDMCDVISSLIEDRSKCEEELALSQELVKEKYGLYRIARKLFAIYKEIPRNNELSPPVQVTNTVNEERRYFISPLVAIYENEVFVPNDNGYIEKHCLTGEELRIMSFCKKAVPAPSLYSKFGFNEHTLSSPIESLLNKKILIEC